MPSRLTTEAQRAQRPEERKKWIFSCLLSVSSGSLWLDPLLLELDVEAQTLDLVAQHVEAGGRACFQGVLALDHRLVDLRAALHVVGLHGQQFLQDVRRAVGL